MNWKTTRVQFVRNNSNCSDAQAEYCKREKMNFWKSWMLEVDKFGQTSVPRSSFRTGQSLSNSVRSWLAALLQVRKSDKKIDLGKLYFYKWMKKYRNMFARQNSVNFIIILKDNNFINKFLFFIYIYRILLYKIHIGIKWSDYILSKKKMIFFRLFSDGLIS